MGANDLTHAQMQQLERLAPDHARIVRQMQRQERRKARATEPSAPAAESAGEVVVDLTDYYERLTVGDVEDMEKASGVPTFAMTFFGGSTQSIAGMAALIWVLRRKVDTKFTYADARALPMPVLTAAMKRFNEAKTTDAEEEDGDDAPLAPSESPSA